MTYQSETAASSWGVTVAHLGTHSLYTCSASHAAAAFQSWTGCQKWQICTKSPATSKKEERASKVMNSVAVREEAANRTMMHFAVECR
ncbi:hypothetical protein BaRGS_00032687 [Batillaria attramentaria]|uniref:Uncharacterized protein n=1 Tax=Batillaria attramentaria TaxID=370345 RepID=A0ABD0JM20_9CAEN